MGSERASGAATLEEVARAAGVSLATASRALNGSTRKVNPEYRERVLAAARTLNYSPNLAAQAVAKGGTSTVALVVADISDPYFASIASGVMRAAEERGLIVTIGSTERRPERETALVRVLRGQRPRSIILVGSRWAAHESDRELADELTAFERAGGRVTMVSQAELPFRTIDIRNREGAAALAGQLIKHGYRSAAILTGPDGPDHGTGAGRRVRGRLRRARPPDRREVDGAPGTSPGTAASWPPPSCAVGVSARSS